MRSTGAANGCTRVPPNNLKSADGQYRFGPPGLDSIGDPRGGIGEDFVAEFGRNVLGG